MSTEHLCSICVPAPLGWVGPIYEWIGVDAWGHLTSSAYLIYQVDFLPTPVYKGGGSYLHFKECWFAFAVCSPGLACCFYLFLITANRLLAICVWGLFFPSKLWTFFFFQYLGLVCNQFYNPSLHLSTEPEKEATGIVLAEVNWNLSLKPVNGTVPLDKSSYKN